MATVLERVPVDRIRVEAASMAPGRTLLTVLAGVLFAAGWLAAKTFTVLWAAVVWSVAAFKVGWQDARRAGGG